VAASTSTSTSDLTPETPAGTRLDSWKEIAAYLKRDVATARRWEKRESLPVHRHQHEKQGSVYAFTGELDAWADGRRQSSHQRQPPIRWRARTGRPALFMAAASVVLALTSGAIWLGLRGPTGADGPIRSIAVLPFESLDPAVREQALEVGMADALIRRLAGLQGVVVRPLSAVQQYADAGTDRGVISRRLRVDALVLGKVHRDGGRIRVSVQLIRTGDASPMFSRDFEEPFTGVFAVQDSIVGLIARTLSLTLENGTAKRAAGRETSNLQAYQAFLLGRYFRNQVTEDGLRKAVQHLKEAVALDPDYAVAHAALADAHTLWSNFTIVPSREAYLNAKAAALEALRLDDTLADAHTTLAMVNLFHDWDWGAAEREFKRALALDPNNARVHQRYGLGLMWLGKFADAHREIGLARELDPVALEIHGNLSLVSYFARRYDDAISEARRTLEMDPHAYQAHRTIGRALVEQGKPADAIPLFQQAIAAGGAARGLAIRSCGPAHRSGRCDPSLVLARAQLRGARAVDGDAESGARAGPASWRSAVR
jgi:TolB-like protein/Tfp pilus assembly protein PilF